MFPLKSWGRENCLPSRKEVQGAGESEATGTDQCLAHQCLLANECRSWMSEFLSHQSDGSFTVRNCSRPSCLVWAQSLVQTFTAK